MALLQGWHFLGWHKTRPYCIDVMFAMMNSLKNILDCLVLSAHVTNEKLYDIKKYVNFRSAKVAVELFVANHISGKSRICNLFMYKCPFQKSSICLIGLDCKRNLTLRDRFSLTKSSLKVKFDCI